MSIVLAPSEENTRVNTNNKGSFWSRPIGNLPLQQPLVVSEGTSVAACIDGMQDQSIGCAVVVDETEHITGIFTERDVMTKFIGSSLDSETPVREVMTPNALCLDPDASVSDAVDFFGRHQIRHVPVCRQKQDLSGLLSIRVLTNFIAENLPEHILNLPPQEGMVSQEAAGA